MDDAKKAKELFLFAYQKGDDNIKSQAKILLSRYYPEKSAPPITFVQSTSPSGENFLLKWDTEKNYVFNRNNKENTEINTKKTILVQSKKN